MSEQLYDPFFVPDKDPAFEYYWANAAERNMVEFMHQGWEVVKGAPELPPSVRSAISGLTGQSTEVPVTEEVRRRGDLILMRIPKDLYEQRVAGPVKRALERQRSSLDTLVEQANEQARKALAQANQRTIRQRHVFTASDDPSFEDQGVAKKE